jgi:hypothetical protein
LRGCARYGNPGILFSAVDEICGFASIVADTLVFGLACRRLR